MAANSFELALALLVSKIDEVSEIPGSGVKEVIGGNVPFNEEGIFVLSARERTEYATHPPVEPTSSEADVLFAIQVGRRALDAIVADKPISALSRVAGALREKIEAESSAGTFSDFAPGMEVMVVRSEPLFAEAVGIGVLEVEIVMGGYQ